MGIFIKRKTILIMFNKINIFPILFIGLCTLLCITNASTTAPASSFVSGRLIYGPPFQQGEISSITVAFYDASGNQVNPATIDISSVIATTSVSTVGAINKASSAYGVQFMLFFQYAGSQTLIISVNGATVRIPIYVNATVFASGRFVSGNTFNTSTVYHEEIAFYNPSGNQINPRIINESSLSAASVPAGAIISNLRGGAFGIQFDISFTNAGSYKLNVNLNGQTVSLDVVVNRAEPSGRATTAPTTNTCVGEVQLVERSGAESSWTSESGTYKIYDVNVVNRGTCKITSAAFPYYFIAPGTITSSWNLRLDSPQGYGSVVVYDSINPGSTYKGAGFIIANYTTYSNHFSASPVMCSSC